MGCISSNSELPDNNNAAPQQFYAQPSQTNVLSPPKKDGGRVSATEDRYDAANKMMQSAPQAYHGLDQYPPAHGRQDSMASMGSVASLSDKLDFNFSLRNIPKLDVMSPSDPFIVVSIKDEAKNIYVNVGKTEIVWDNPNPDFSKDVRVNYMFEAIQYVRLDIYDADEQQTTDLTKHDFIGTAEFVVGDLVTAPGQKLVMAILDRSGSKIAKVKGQQPTLIVRAQEIDDNCDEVAFEFAARGLPKCDTFGKIDGFFQIYRSRSANQNEWASLYKSEHVPSNFNPQWKPLKVESRRLCQGDMHRPILIRVWDWNRDAQPDYACEVKTSLAQLIDVSTLKLRQWDPKRQTYKNKNCGELLIKNCNILKMHSFVSFLKGGLELQLMVAIDFTGSNGDPRDSKSLHYMGHPQYESQYMKVIKSVGRVLAPYDADGQIAAYGFGANLNPNGKQVSHCFNLTLKPDEEEVDGIDGLCEAYKQCLNRVQLYGPTYFGEILQNVAAKSIGICSQEAQTYHIFLIITDGVINDMQRSIDAIVDATRLPLSIIIVGVGDADFANMETLDADEVPLRHSQTGTLMERDIVQFVPFNEFREQHFSAIARETLEEVPKQVTSFMAQQQFHPQPPRVEQAVEENMYAHLAPAGQDDDAKMPEIAVPVDFQPAPSVPSAPWEQNAYAPGYAANGGNVGHANSSEGDITHNIPPAAFNH